MEFPREINEKSFKVLSHLFSNNGVGTGHHPPPNRVGREEELLSTIREKASPLYIGLISFLKWRTQKKQKKHTHTELIPLLKLTLAAS